MLRTTGFHHVTLVAADAPRTVAFYRDLLGFRLHAPADPEAGAGAPPFLHFGDEHGTPGTLVRVVVAGASTGRGRYGVGGVHHLALGVRDQAAQLQWKRRLTDAGVAVSGPYDRGWFHSIYFRDPDGQVVEIATHGPGYAKDEPADALGQRLVHPAAHQLRGTERDERLIAVRTHPEPVPAITDDMRLTGLHHVTGMTDDLARAGDFYEEALGLRLVKRSVNQDDPDTLHNFWASYDGAVVAPNSSFTLFGWSPRAPRARGGIGQLERVAFRVPDDDAQLAWRDHLRTLGVAVSPVVDRGGFRSFTFSAPDGQPLELATDQMSVRRVAPDAHGPGKPADA